MGRLDNLKADIANRKQELENIIAENLKKSAIIQSIQVQEPKLADTIVSSVSSAGVSTILALMNLFSSYGILEADRRTQIGILTEVAEMYNIPIVNEDKLYEDVANLINTNELAQKSLINAIMVRKNGVIENS